MPNSTQLSKWGHSLAVRIPREIAREARLAEGDQVSLEVTSERAIVVRSSRPRYSVDELVSRITPKNRHAALDWGTPWGKEIW